MDQFHPTIPASLSRFKATLAVIACEFWPSVKLILARLTVSCTVLALTITTNITVRITIATSADDAFQCFL